ncbi:hypothetical protein SISSUDRAFT_1030564 [Sistotremastrum suecicum HHB10207 ss-3]|uniref:Uncharacterized protein n=1 Tax=Sistotremastrum suecicum HHB10207 ss-3 TaxID=1314776 RepID=A0A166H3D1_9AGAM|nr:hypothetical protein SISSUDRAFT_1030564 [Sistotremastrum suecicum HHB10207 ss-3]
MPRSWENDEDLTRLSQEQLIDRISLERARGNKYKERCRRIPLGDATNRSGNEDGGGSNDDDGAASAPPAKKRKKAASYEDIDLSVRETIKSAGRKFSVMSSLWLEQPSVTFSVPFESDFDPDTRFDSPENRIQGQLQDLYANIDTTLHSYFEKKGFQALLIEGINEQRSNSVSRIRLLCGPEIFDVKPKVMKSAALRNDAFRVLIGWKPDAIREGIASKPGYVTMAPILYKDHENGLLHKNLFMNPELLAVAQAVLWGPSSVYTDAPGATPHKTVASLWGLRCATPGLVAFCCVLAIFSLSHDLHFDPTGAATGIEYFDNFQFYLKIISDGVRHRKKAMLAVMQFWNKTLFSHTLPRSQKGGLDLTRQAALLAQEGDETASESEHEDEDQGEQEGENGGFDDHGHNGAPTDGDQLNAQDMDAE